jgi:predicted acylesterase/phospholipase RssA
MILLAIALLAAGPPPARVAFTISGGVSLGSYEAGLIWALVRDLRGTKADLTAVTGASAGAVNALLAAALWCEDEGEPDLEGSLLHQAWAGIGLEDLLADPGSGGGVLSAAPLERAVERIGAFFGGRRFRPGCSLPVGWTVTRDRPEEQNIDGLTARAQRFLIALRFAVDAEGRPHLARADLPAGSESASAALSLGLPAAGEVGFEQTAQAILASAAFPVAFRPRELCDCALACPEADTVGDGACEGPYRGEPIRGLGCPAPRQLCRRRYLDGGIFDNAPVGLAVDLAESNRSTLPPFQAATYVVVDPDVRRLEPQGARKAYVLPETAELIRNLIGTARERELLHTMRAENWQRNTVRTLAEAAQLQADIGSVQQETARIAGAGASEDLAPLPSLFRSPRREELGRFLLRCVSALARDDVPPQSPELPRCARALREGDIAPEEARLSAIEVGALAQAVAAMISANMARVDSMIAELGTPATALERRLQLLVQLLDGSTVIVATFRYLAGELSGIGATLSEAQLRVLRRNLLVGVEVERLLRATDSMLHAFAWAVLIEEGVAAGDYPRAERLAALEGPIDPDAPERVARLAALAQRLRGLSARAQVIGSNAARLAAGDAGERRLLVLRRFAPLGSGQLYNFSGFLDRGLRELDFYVGVYDAVRSIGTYRCDFQGPYPAADRPAPIFRSDAPLELDLSAEDTQRCVGLAMRSIVGQLGLSRSQRASYVIARLSQLELAVLLGSRASTAKLAAEPSWAWLGEPPLPPADPIAAALSALTSRPVPCRPGAAESLCLAEMSFEDFLDALKASSYPPQSPSMREALDNRDHWRAGLMSTLMDRAAAAESRTGRKVPDTIATGMGLGQLWTRRAWSLSSDFRFEADPSTIPGVSVAHLLPYRVALDVTHGGIAFSWLEPELRFNTRFALQSIVDVLAIDGAGQLSSHLGALATVRALDISLGAGLQATIPWNGDPILPPGPALRLGWLQDRLAVTGSLRSSAEGHRQASITLSVADLNGLVYWLALR